MEDFSGANRPAMKQEAQRRSVKRKTDREPHDHRKDETGCGLSTGESSADESTRQKIKEVISMKEVSTKDKRMFAAMKVYEDIALKLQHMAKATASELSDGIDVNNSALSELRMFLTDCADNILSEISEKLCEVYDEDLSDEENNAVFEAYGVLKYADM